MTDAIEWPEELVRRLQRAARDSDGTWPALWQVKAILDALGGEMRYVAEDAGSLTVLSTEEGRWRLPVLVIPLDRSE